MSAPSRILYISDVHMASHARYEDHSSWFRPEHHSARLISFLERKLLEPPEQLVLLGDIFENWLAPVEAIPSSWQEILGSNQNFLEACYHLHTPHDQPFPGTVLSTGTEATPAGRT